MKATQGHGMKASQGHGMKASQGHGMKATQGFLKAMLSTPLQENTQVGEVALSRVSLLQEMLKRRRAHGQ